MCYNGDMETANITKTTLQPSGIEGFAVETRKGTRYALTLEDAESIARIDADMIEDSTRVGYSNVEYSITFRTREVAEEAKARIEAAFPEAGYGTSLRVRGTDSSAFYKLHGFRSRSCD